MARIVLGIGTSHSPLLAIDPATWAERAKDDLAKKELALSDGRVVTYGELEAEVGARYAGQAVVETFERQAKQAQRSLDHLSRVIAESEVDVLIVIGDDQDELFSRAHLPAVAVYTGAEIVTHPKNEVNPGLPAWYQQANHGYQMDTVYRHPAAPALAAAVVDGLIERGVDVAIAAEVADPYRAGFGHAYGFVMARLCGDRDIPILPIMLNTYFPPNVPRPARCVDLGAALREAVAAFDADLRVGVVASGGLTHFAVDADLDRTVLRAFEQHDLDALRALPAHALRSGNSEILNWITTAGAVGDLSVSYLDYIPVYRTPAGTGIGLAFAVWQQPEAGDRK